MAVDRINENVFRAYDIRGIYPTDIDEDLAYSVARAYSTFLKGKTVAVSMDVRLSSEKLAEPFMEGLTDSGLEVWFIGTAPTPLLYFAVAHYKLDGGVAISASHNPPEWNGFKLCGKHAKVLGLGEGLERIKEILISSKFASPRARGFKIDKEAKVKEDYEKFLIGNLGQISRIRIGVDPGNGASSGFASRILRGIGVDVYTINDMPDGRFPSRSPEPRPENLEGLQRLVKGKKLDFGVAFDGDGDRAIFVDDRGEVFYGDKILALFTDNLLKSGDKVVYDVSCSEAVSDVVKKRGGIPIITKVGHAAIESKMLEENARIGGELSGHIYFMETYHYDDALFAAALMAKLISDSGKAMSELIERLPKYKNAVKEFGVGDSVKFKVIDIVRRQLESRKVKTVNIDGVKVITDNGWFIIRASNTTPKIKVVAEAKTEERLKELVDMASNEVVRAINNGS